jgi:hypothetical protein
MITRGSFPGVRREGREADHLPPSSAEVKECVELYLHSPNVPPRRGAQLKQRDNFTFICFYFIFVMELRKIMGSSVRIAGSLRTRAKYKPNVSQTLYPYTNTVQQ